MTIMACALLPALMVLGMLAPVGTAGAEGAGPPPFECSHDFRNTYMEWDGREWVCSYHYGSYPTGYRWAPRYMQV